MTRNLYLRGPKALPLLLIGLSAALCNCGLSTPAQSRNRTVDYAYPELLVGNIFAMGPSTTECLFKSERRGTRSGTNVLVTCDYTSPSGSLAARDRIVYEAGRLASFEEEELQTGESGSAKILPDPKNPGHWRVYFEYVIGQGSTAKRSSSSESLENDTLIDDMIPAFIDSHWETLEKGSAVKFRYIVLSREETVGFKLVKETETIWRGQSVVRIKMVPTSFIIAQLVDPLVFMVEKNGKHRILEYDGRTTPLVRNGNKWKELDAISVFDWKQE